MSAHICLTRYFSTRLISRAVLLFIIISILCIHNAQSSEMLRKVLVLYNSETNQTADKNTVFVHFQTILNYLGVMPEYVDVNVRPLPDDKAMLEYRGVITSFNSSEMRKPEEFLSWINRQFVSGGKVVVIGNIGAPDSSDFPGYKKLLDDYYSNIGLMYGRDTTINRNLIRYVYKDKTMVEFERAYSEFPHSYVKFTPANENVKTHLSIKRVDRTDSDSVVIVTSPNGGYAHLGYIFWLDSMSYRKQWLLNPFKFLEESLGLKGMPRLDPTTLNGLRVAFAHIDGDSFSVISEIDRKSVCADIIKEKILKKYDFPASVSVITGEIAPEALGKESLMNLAREIFRMPNVEPASHSYSHPFYWDSDYEYKNDYDYRHIQLPGYVYDSKKEIEGSINYINERLVPQGKVCETFFWTGNCEPVESDIEICDNLGALNINGDETIFDELRDSYLFVAPLYRKVGERYQFYSGQSNENVLTNNWTSPFYGYRKIVDTMKNTGFPKRLKPIDIYYHFYCGQYLASLKSLEYVYDWVLKQETAKVFASDYIKMARDYLEAKIYENEPGVYRIENYGKCLTVRFDNASKLPDIARSSNVIGYANDPQGLYVSLAAEKDHAVIVFNNKNADAETRVGVPYIKRASGWIYDFETSGKEIKFDYKGFGTGSIVVNGVAPNALYKISGEAVEAGGIKVMSNNKGHLVIDVVKTGGLEIVVDK